MATVVKIHEAEMRALLTSPSGDIARELMIRGRRVQTRAKQLVHVDTGRLRASITVTPVTSDGQLAVHIGSNVEYAGYLEEGTRRSKAYPYLKPALEAAFT